MLSDHAEGGTMRQGKKIHTAAIGMMLCLATLTTGACVTQSTYDIAALDLKAAKAELHSTSVQTQELTQQVSHLQQRKSDLSKQMVVASLAFDQTTKEVKGERAASQKRLSNLTRTIKQLTSQQKSLREGFKRATKEQARLQSVVDNYTSTQGSIDELNASSVHQPAEPATTALVSPAQTPVQNEPALKPTVTATAAPANQPASIPKPPINQPPEPIEEDWLSFLKKWVASLWQSVIF